MADSEEPWVRVRSNVGEWDVHETQVAEGLPEGVVVIDGYPGSHYCRPAKPHVSKDGQPAARQRAGQAGGKE